MDLSKRTIESILTTTTGAPCLRDTEGTIGSRGRDGHPSTTESTARATGTAGTTKATICVCVDGS